MANIREQNQRLPTRGGLEDPSETIIDVKGATVFLRAI